MVPGCNHRPEQASKMHMDHNTEREYIRRILDGETRLFSCFLSEYGDQVYRLIRTITSSPEESEELTQDVFVKAYSKLSTFSGKSRFSTWLYRIAYNTAISRTRKKKPERFTVDEKALERLSGEEVDRLLEGDDNEERLLKLESAVAALAPDERLLLDLYYTEDRSVQELSGITGLSPSNVKIKLHRIRKKLYVMVKSEGHE